MAIVILHREGWVLCTQMNEGTVLWFLSFYYLCWQVKSDWPKNSAAKTRPTTTTVVFQKPLILSRRSACWPGTFLLPEFCLSFNETNFCSCFHPSVFPASNAPVCLGITGLKCSDMLQGEVICWENTHKLPKIGRDWNWVKYVVRLGYWRSPGNHQWYKTQPFFLLVSGAISNAIWRSWAKIRLYVTLVLAEGFATFDGVPDSLGSFSWGIFCFELQNCTLKESNFKN